MIELLCTDYNKKATFIHYNLNSAVLASISDDKYRHKVEMVNLVLTVLIMILTFQATQHTTYEIYL